MLRLKNTNGKLFWPSNFPFHLVRTVVFTRCQVTVIVTGFRIGCLSPGVSGILIRCIGFTLCGSDSHLPESFPLNVLPLVSQLSLLCRRLYLPGCLPLTPSVEFIGDFEVPLPSLSIRPGCYPHSGGCLLSLAW